MNPKIEYILKHDRFPFTSVDRVIMFIIFSVIALAVAYISYNYQKPSYIIGATIVGLLVGFSIYQGYKHSMEFKKIQTGFSQLDNEELIQYSLRQLNFKVFKDKDYENVFVCFIHDQLSGERQEIYVIAKDYVILINSDKTKNTDDTDGTVDFVDKIGMTIYQNVMRLHQKQKIN